MKYLTGVLALAALCAAGPEADPAYFLPYAYPVLGSGYAGPLPGRSYQAVSRLHLHKREAEADPQILLNAAPFAPLAPTAPVAAAFNVAPLPPVPAPVFATAEPVINAPVVKSVVEHPAEVAHSLHATPLALPVAPVAPVAPVVHAPAIVPAAHTASVVGLGPRDCVTEAGCALRTALATGFPAATFGSATVVGRKRREAEAEPEAEAEADPFLFYNNYFGGYPYASYPYSAYPYAPAYPYNLLNPYNYVPAPVAVPEPVVAPVAEPVVEVKAAPAVVAPATPLIHAAPAPLVHAVPTPVVHAVPAPAVHTTSKQVTYTHLGAHPIQPTTVVQTESRLVL